MGSILGGKLAHDCRQPRPVVTWMDNVQP